MNFVRQADCIDMLFRFAVELAAAGRLGPFAGDHQINRGSGGSRGFAIPDRGHQHVDGLAFALAHLRFLALGQRFALFRSGFLRGFRTLDRDFRSRARPVRDDRRNTFLRFVGFAPVTGTENRISRQWIFIIFLVILFLSVVFLRYKNRLRLLCGKAGYIFLALLFQIFPVHAARFGEQIGEQKTGIPAFPAGRAFAAPFFRPRQARQQRGEPVIQRFAEFAYAHGFQLPALDAADVIENIILNLRRKRRDRFVVRNRHIAEGLALHRLLPEFGKIQQIEPARHPARRVADLRGKAVQRREFFPHGIEFGDLFRQREIRMLVRKVGVDLRITVDQDRILTEFEFREFEVEQRQKTAAAVVHRIVVIRIVFQLLQRNRLQQRLQAFVQPAFDARTQVHVIRFVVGTVRFTLNSTDGKFRVHVLLSFRVEDIPSGISRLTSQGREIPRFADQSPGALRR